MSEHVTLILLQRFSLKPSFINVNLQLESKNDESLKLHTVLL